MSATPAIATAVTLRPATLADADLLLEWANDPDVRDASFNSGLIEREEHVTWLRERLEDPNVAFYIAECEGRSIGYSRLERRSDDRAEIAVSVDRRFRGQGLGRRIIVLGNARGREELGVWRVVAHVKTTNEASVRAFRAAGFGQSRPAGNDAVELILDEPLTVPHSRPFVGEAEAQAAAAVVRSRALVQGRVAAELEAIWCELTGMSAAACVGSGVAALRLALLGLGIGAGDEVIVPAYSCVALLNAPLSLGATPVLADVETDRWTIAPDDVAARFSERTRAIVAVDLFGAPAALDELCSMGVPVVEDCAHGIGGRTAVGPFGGGTDISLSSFYATKMIGAGEGGIVAARDPELIERVRAARDYGDRLPSSTNLNDKLTDVEAAIALEQIRRLDEILALRAERAGRYARLLAPLVEAGAVVLPIDEPGRIWYRYVVRLTRHPASEVCALAAARGVRLEQPVWDLRAAGEWSDDLVESAAAFTSVISLPLYPDLSPSELEAVADTFADILQAA